MLLVSVAYLIIASLIVRLFRAVSFYNETIERAYRAREEIETWQRKIN